MICVSISHLTQLDRVLAQGAALVELRLDLIAEDPEVLYERIGKDVKTVVTCRPETVSDTERARLLAACIHHGATYVDLELEADSGFTYPLIELAGEKACEVIISHHDFERTPSEETLQDLLGQCFQRGANVAKIATMVHDRDDLVRLFSLYRSRGRKVVLGMGDAGRISRVAGPYLGAEFTFAAPGEGSETAPGQLSFQELQDINKLIDPS